MRFRTTWIAGVLLLGFAHDPSARLSAQNKPARPKRGATRAEISYEKQVRPLFEKYCYACHGNGKKKGDLALDAYKSPADAVNDPKTWEKILQNLEGHVMPPEKKPQPSPGEADLILSWIQSQVFKCDCQHPDPGRVTLRRLNRAEYNNTIRDLVGVPFQPAEDFPADDSGYGFDNIGDVLSMPPVLMEKYLASAEKILDRAIQTADRHKPKVRHFEARKMDIVGGSAPEGDVLVMFGNGECVQPVDIKEAGKYLIRIRAAGDQ